ncbi:heavy-metal-associated domain-containing protein [Thioalkalivibrio denitrificans]|uniref:heavy-metal-associated domain-containing protein n=1 Tax=Thioalkalivibrio denitrificans TaxID=108003 RepID=UPI0011155356|nr:cation transporter [Thioalkalivibrio denitrificans]
MLTTLYSNTGRLAMLIVAIVLGLGLLAGCSDEPTAGTTAANSSQTANDIQATVARHQARFSVPGMDCPMCPITVKRALGNVDGVIEADADLKTKQAYVVFDPSQTDTYALVAAIENAGFSASLENYDHE